MPRCTVNLPATLKREAEEFAAERCISLEQFIMWSVIEKVAALRQPQDELNFPSISYRRGGVLDWSRPVFRGTGIHVQTAVVYVEKLKERSPEKFAENYGLNVEQVREALRFYHAHPAEIDVNIKDEDALERQHIRQRKKEQAKAKTKTKAKKHG